MKKFLLAAAIIGSAAVTSTANASPVVFVYTDTVGSTNIPGLAAGSPLTIDVFADNGSSSLASQSWNGGQTNGFTVTAAGYSASFSEVFSFSNAPNQNVFDTDASGNVVGFTFQGTDGNSVNSDNFDSWIGDTVVYGFGLTDDVGYFLDAKDIPANTAHWTVQFLPTSVPEPLTLSLFGAGLAGAVAMRRRKAKRA
ncbi:MAG TPA: PEP-CTERM sorting domain-containing protein [Rhodopila sp.]|nr:PEP-CTERM sorting domain-containing protein [Rhodopila sp.]